MDIHSVFGFCSCLLDCYWSNKFYLLVVFGFVCSTIELFLSTGVSVYEILCLEMILMRALVSLLESHHQSTFHRALRKSSMHITILKYS